MNTIIFLLASYSLMFIIKEADGPFDIFLKARRALMSIKYFGPMFYNVFACYFCSGIHASWLMYLLYVPMTSWYWRDFFVYTFAGASFSYIISIILENVFSKSN
jgi:hypothetical protein